MKQLEYIEKPARSGTANHVMIFLHGVGADAHDLMGLSEDFAHELPDFAFISCNAPFYFDMAPFGYQWFSLQDRDEKVLYEGIKTASPILNNFIDSILSKYKLSDDKLIICGFSQGTMMALHTMPRRAKPCAGIIGFSGTLIGRDHLKSETISFPPILLTMGEEDQVIDPRMLDYTSNTLKKHGFETTPHLLPHLGHSINQEATDLAIEFIKNHL